MAKSLTLKEELLRDTQECIDMSSKITKNCVAIREKVERCDEKAAELYDRDIGYLEGIKKTIDLLHKILSENFW